MEWLSDVRLAARLFTLQELRLKAQGCRASRLPWEHVAFVQIPQRGYVIAPFGMTQPFQGRHDVLATNPRVAAKRGNPGLYDVTPSE